MLNSRLLVGITSTASPPVFFFVSQTGSMPEPPSVPAFDAVSTPPHAPQPLTAPVLHAKNATDDDSFKGLSFLLRNERFGDRSKFTAENDHILIRKVFGVRAHVTPQGETRELLEEVASKANS